MYPCNLNTRYRNCHLRPSLRPTVHRTVQSSNHLRTVQSSNLFELSYTIALHNYIMFKQSNLSGYITPAKQSFPLTTCPNRKPKKIVDPNAERQLIVLPLELTKSYDMCPDFIPAKSEVPKPYVCLIRYMMETSLRRNLRRTMFLQRQAKRDPQQDQPTASIPSMQPSDVSLGSTSASVNS